MMVTENLNFQFMLGYLFHIMEPKNAGNNKVYLTYLLKSLQWGLKLVGDMINLVNSAC